MLLPMESFRPKAKTLEKGQTFAEYALIVALISIAALTAYLGLGRGLNALTGNLATFLNTTLSTL
jgi:Flp pilus assembly pilin Flp